MTAKILDPQTATFLEAIGENLPDIPVNLMQEWIKHPTELRQALFGALCSLGYVTAISPWKTVKLGAWTTRKSSFKTIAVAGVLLSGYAWPFLKKLPFSEVEGEIQLVRLTVRELGFNQPVSRETIYTRAEDLSLETVPVEAVLQLSLQYPEQPMGECLLMAMEPVMGADGEFHILCLARNEKGRWLGLNNRNVSGYSHPNTCWVFGIRKKG